MYETIEFVFTLMRELIIIFGVFKCEPEKKKRIGILILIEYIVSMIIIYVWRNNPFGVWFNLLTGLTIRSAMLKRKCEFPIAIAGVILPNVIDDIIASFMCAWLDQSAECLFEWKYFLIQNTISLSCILCVYLIVEVVRKDLYKKQEQEKYYHYMPKTRKVMVGIDGIGLVLGVYLSELESVFLQQSERKIGILILEIAIIVGLLIFCLIYVMSVEKRERYRTENLYYKKIVSSQKQYYEKMLEREEQTKKYRHDVSNHILVMDGMLQQGKVEETRAYLKSIHEYVQAAVIQKTSGNALLDIILQDVWYEMKGIDVKWVGSFPVELNMENMDICILFSNLFTNAIEAVKDVEGKKIEVEIKGFGTNLLIRESNTYKNKIIEKKGVLHTTKQQKEIHGIGMQNMKEVVEKYNGSLTYQVGEVFTIEIILENVIN